jgi:hypothetical protein
MSLSYTGFALLALAVLLGLLWVVRGKQTPLGTSPPAAPDTSRNERDRLDYLKRSGLYWGVAIRTRGNSSCCPQARDILDRPYPLDQAPQLPLPGCDLDCQCHYQPLLEKRDAKMRRVHHDRRSILRYEPDKRDRRQLPTRRG